MARTCCVEMSQVNSVLSGLQSGEEEGGVETGGGGADQEPARPRHARRA